MCRLVKKTVCGGEGGGLLNKKRVSMCWLVRNCGGGEGGGLLNKKRSMCWLVRNCGGGEGGGLFNRIRNSGGRRGVRFMKEISDARGLPGDGTLTLSHVINCV